MRSVVLALRAELAACVRVDFDPNGRDAGGDAPLALRARGVWSSAGNALSHTPAASGAQTFHVRDVVPVVRWRGDAAGPFDAESVHFDYVVPGHNLFAGQADWTVNGVTSAIDGLPY